MSTLPTHTLSTHRALVLTTTKSPPTVQTIPKPIATPGSVIVRILYTNVLPYARDIYNGSRKIPIIPTPFVPGSAAIGRVSEIGSDATILTPGQLVLVDTFIRARDNPTTAILHGYTSGRLGEGGPKLAESEWRDSTYAEFAKCPLENCYPVDEARLCGAVKDGGLGYSILDIIAVWPCMVAYGGLKDISLLAGETIIVAPATGTFGGGAVVVALAMGARVVAAGRNESVLKKIKALSDRVEVVKLTGEVDVDAQALASFGTPDTYIDFSPHAAAKSTHIKSALTALKINGRASLMGGISDDVAIPYLMTIIKSLQLKGKWMYERDDCLGFIKLIERGLLKLGPEMGFRVAGTFGLDEWEKAIDEAAKSSGFGAYVVLEP